MCAIGNSGAYFAEEKINVMIEGVKIVQNGKSSSFDLSKLKKKMKSNEIKIAIDLKLGKEEATAYGCDMGIDYIKINALYRT